MLSSESQKYINNAILMSGTAETIWSMSNTNDIISWAYKYAADDGQPKQSIDELIDYFKSAPSSKFSNTPLIESTTFITFVFKFAPVIES